MYQLGTLQFPDPLHQLQQNILHVDMDAFYASLAERDNPTLVGKPVIMARHPLETGGTGIITTANYIARQYGVHSGMSSMEAYRRCPEAVFVPVNHPYIRSVSKQLYAIFLSFTPDVQRVAYDEAYLSLPHDADGEKIARQIRQRVSDELKLTCSVGVSYNKILAKMASDHNKPDGMTIITPTDAVAFLDQLSVREFHGIGPKTASRLHELGVTTIKELKMLPMETLTTIFGSGTETFVQRINGIDPRPVDPTRDAKSSGNERTFHPFLSSNKEVQQALIELIDKLGDTLERDGSYGTTVVLKLRDANFKNYSKRLSVDYLFHDKATLYDLAIQCWLTLREKILQPIRLVGVTLVGLDQQEQGGNGQGLLF